MICPYINRIMTWDLYLSHHYLQMPAAHAFVGMTFSTSFYGHGRILNSHTETYFA